LNKATDETAKPILTRNISKRVSPPEVRNFRGSKSSKTPQNWPEQAFRSQIHEVVK